MTAERFYRLAKSHVRSMLNANITYNFKICPDKCVGVIGCLKFPFAYQPIVKRAGMSRVFLILESPHKRERDIGPANGTTGRIICDVFDKIFKNRLNGYELCLVNAVSFQCSLGLPLPQFSSVKDMVFQWAIKKLKRDLKMRMVSYGLTENDVVIIACSKNPAKCQEVLSVVQTAVSRNVRIIPNFYHPSIWKKKLSAVKEFADKCM